MQQCFDEQVLIKWQSVWSG